MSGDWRERADALPASGDWSERAEALAVSGDWSERRLHFVGIGGAGMSALALVARALGAQVTCLLYTSPSPRD